VDSGEASQGEQPDESPIGRLRSRRPYWAAAMRYLCMVCALTLSMLDSGYRLEWNPLTGPSPARWRRNHQSALEHSKFESEKVAEGVTLGTMHACGRTDLVCILPLGVAINSAGKLMGWSARKRPPPTSNLSDGDPLMRGPLVVRVLQVVRDRRHFGGLPPGDAS